MPFPVRQPVRDHFTTDANAKELLKKVKARCEAGGSCRVVADPALSLVARWWLNDAFVVHPRAQSYKVTR